jgi:Ran GTPase-activating protein (RanGAP) involved in mRNA processing and transport
MSFILEWMSGWNNLRSTERDTTSASTIPICWDILNRAHTHTHTHTHTHIRIPIAQNAHQTESKANAPEQPRSNTHARVHQTLNLGWNAIKFEGVRALARAIEGGACAEMLTLGLQANHLGDDSIQVLMAAFVTTHEGLKLTHLNVNQNAITAKGAGYIASTLFKEGTMSKLKILNLEHNRIEEAGAKHILSAMRVRVSKAIQAEKEKQARINLQRTGTRRRKVNKPSKKNTNLNRQLRLRIRGNRIRVDGNVRLMKSFAGIVAL